MEPHAKTVSPARRANSRDGVALARAILTRLTITPYSVDELADDMQAPTREVRCTIKGLMSEGEVVFLEGRAVEGGPFFCRPDYHETTKPFDKTEEYVRRSFAVMYDGEDPD